MMNKIGLFKILFLLFTADYIESLVAPILINAYINLPLTFLTFSFIIYKSGSYSSPIFSFSAIKIQNLKKHNSFFDNFM